MTTTQIPDADFKLLADAERPCPVCDGAGDGPTDVGCKGTGVVAKYEWARVECEYMADNGHRKWECDDVRGYKAQPIWWASDGDCPGHRPITLAEAASRLETILVAEAIVVLPIKGDKRGGYLAMTNNDWEGWESMDDAGKFGTTPTQAAVNAVLAMEKEK